MADSGRASSAERTASPFLTSHVKQIQRYVEQRALRYGVLFNGRHMLVYPRGHSGHDRALSFDLLAIWRAARGEQLPVGPDFDAFTMFREVFSHRTLSTADKIAHIRTEESWAERLADAEVDVEFLVELLVLRLVGERRNRFLVVDVQREHVDSRFADRIE
jgi:hypothetical protein